MSSYSSTGCYGLSRPGSNSNERLISLSYNKLSRHNKLSRKKSSFRRDPVLILSYFVLVGVLISGLASFGL
ncbi:hypothetical protein [sulfur-oxidizing endosymbiont of Gigantopelta aegis]|uniref:hypothetical protein n=1 Tax=sulfur-oxidizing endosymbiont of Gigantopelta aegis TaxID=2794934 RepID=UPI0018DBB89A|nr:hypothetical protein [sulfur-oxidizing endosymbiont of Gigantopelta aegis]